MITISSNILSDTLSLSIYVYSIDLAIHLSNQSSIYLSISLFIWQLGLSISTYLPINPTIYLSIPGGPQKGRFFFLLNSKI